MQGLVIKRAHVKSKNMQGTKGIRKHKEGQKTGLIHACEAKDANQNASKPLPEACTLKPQKHKKLI